MKTRHGSSASVQRHIETAAHEPVEKIEAILVAVDFSTTGRSALQFANTLARQLDCRITVINVVEPIPTNDPNAISANLAHGRDLRETQQTLESFTLREVEKNLLASTQVFIGKPVEQITKCAHSLHADLLLIGVQRDHAGVLAMGSTADALLKNVRCPVLMIPSDLAIHGA